MRRVYVPATVVELRGLQRTGLLADAPVDAIAVTDVLRRALDDGDEEELEAAALLDAAEHSLGKLADELTPSTPDSDCRRVVVVCDVEDAVVIDTPHEGATAVRVEADLHLDAVVCVLCDESAASAAVRSSSAALQTAGWEDDNAMRLVAALDEHALLWWGTQEIAELLEDESR